MHVHHPRVSIRAAPDALQKLGSGHHPAPVLGQGHQEVELPGGEVDLLALDPNAAGRDVDVQSPKPKPLWGFGGFAQPAQRGLDPGHQFPGTEGLGHVIVRSQGQAHHPVRLLGLGREHDDVDVFGLPPQAGEHLQAVHFRQHDVQHHDIRLVGPEGLQRLGARGRGVDPEAFLFQIRLDHLADGRFVVNHEDGG